MSNASDRLSYSIQAAIEMANWYPFDSIFKRAENIKKAITLAVRCGQVSTSTSIPHVLEDQLELKMAYLYGLPEQYKPPISEFFTVSYVADHIAISPTPKFGDDSEAFVINRGDDQWLLFSDTHTPSFWSYKDEMEDDYSTGTQSGLYLNDYNPHSKNAIVFGEVINNSISFGHKKDFSASKRLSPNDLTDFTIQGLVALNTILTGELFKERTQHELDSIKLAAQEILNRSDAPCFLPADGFCISCNADVTPFFKNIDKSQSITGCPLCLRSWCD